MIIISDLSELINKIQELRKQMINLIDTKEELYDPEIISVSRLIDTLLNEYEKLINKKQKVEP